MELQAYRAKGIGVSDGRLVFDSYPGRTKADIDLKRQAASALQQGNTRSALNLLTQAVAADPADGEAQIYKENVRILLSGAPYITIAIGFLINNTEPYLAADRPSLESAFLAQHEINTKGLLPHGLQLRLFIGNPELGSGVAMVTQFIANRVVKAGNLDRIVAFVGWPASGETIDARDIFTAAHIPFVSQFAASVSLSGSSPYFFRVNPTDGQQGTTLGDVAVHQLHATNVLVLQDATDPASVSLTRTFSSYLKLNHVTVLNAGFTKFETTVEDDEQTILSSAMTRRVDLIFLAGYNSDGVRLAHALGEVSRANPTKTFLANLKILGGAALDSDLLLGDGNGPDATLAASYPQDMRRLIFAAFAHPDEWTFLHVPQKQQPDFFANWSDLYQHALPRAENALAPQNESILTYDAVRVIANAVSFVSGPLTGQSVRDALASLGHRNIPAYQGVSGHISFDAQGNPLDKAQVILDIEQRNGQNMIVLHQVAGKFF